MNSFELSANGDMKGRHYQGHAFEVEEGDRGWFVNFAAYFVVAFIVLISLVSSLIALNSPKCTERQRQGTEAIYHCISRCVGKG